SVLSNAPEYIGKQSQSASVGMMAGHLLKLQDNPDLSDRIEVSANGDEVIIRLSEAGFFDSAKADIRKDALPAFQIIGERLESFEGIEILAQGHTDNRPINNLRFRSNRELSTARANAVVAILEADHDIDPGYLVAAGYGEYRPLAPNDTSEGMGRNRRVDIVVRPMVNDAIRLRKEGEVRSGKKKGKRGKKRRR
ncbi:MAG: OmpA family protein, partial [Myxococcota bacterium]|nr:OmpA family protein [Myxococcota bacterium]